MRKVTYILTGTLLVLSVGGYLLPETPEPFPNRILMKNAAGNVVFDHKVHAETRGIECMSCHHDAAEPGRAGQKCKTCHGLEFGPEFRGHSYTMSYETCATCHHMTLAHKDWGHDTHAAMPGVECTACHHGPQIEPAPQNCASCHDAKVDMGPILSLKRAVHTRCKSCHGDRFSPTGMNNCATCHETQSSRDTLQNGKAPQSALIPCGTCHKVEPAKLVPNGMAAYHGLCITCHEKQGGPVENCAQCHTK